MISLERRYAPQSKTATIQSVGPLARSYAFRRAGGISLGKETAKVLACAGRDHQNFITVFRSFYPLWKCVIRALSSSAKCGEHGSQVISGTLVSPDWRERNWTCNETYLPVEEDATHRFWAGRVKSSIIPDGQGRSEFLSTAKLAEIRDKFSSLLMHARVRQEGGGLELRE